MSTGRHPLTVDELVAWEQSGAGWRLAESGPDGVVVELCACTGEPVDLRTGAEPALLAYVREHPPAHD